MTRARLLGAVFAVLVLAACNDSALPPGGTYNAVQGVVIDAATNQPVAGATVTIDTVLTATTDAQGKFAFAQVPAGDVDVVITAPGYKDYSAPARLEPDKPLTLSVSLTKAPATPGNLSARTPARASRKMHDARSRDR